MEITQEEIEDKITDWVIKSAGDRLIVVKPEEKVKGVDLVIKRKGAYESRRAQSLGVSQVVKAQVFGILHKKKTKDILISVNWQKEKEINVNDFPPIKNFYLALVSFDPIKQDIDDNLYFVPLNEFKNPPDKKFLISKKDLGKILLDIISK